MVEGGSWFVFEFSEFGLECPKLEGDTLPVTDDLDTSTVFPGLPIPLSVAWLSAFCCRKILSTINKISFMVLSLLDLVTVVPSPLKCLEVCGEDCHEQ